MKEVIEKLKDDTQYYGEFGKQFLSNSDIGTLLKNPKEFGLPQDDNVNFHKGRYSLYDILVSRNGTGKAVSKQSS